MYKYEINGVLVVSDIDAFNLKKYPIDTDCYVKFELGSGDCLNY